MIFQVPQLKFILICQKQALKLGLKKKVFNRDMELI